MKYFLDTSILLRLSNRTDPDRAVARDAIRALYRRREEMCIAPQVLIEFRNAATRPLSVNGLGMALAKAERESDKFEAVFTLLEERPDIFPAWKELAGSARTIGKQVHDARIAAICKVNAVERLLTFNTRHFVPFEPFIPGFAAVNPSAV